MMTGSLSAAHLTELTTALAGRYRLERELGAGGMATVWLAHDLRHGRRVAIKVLHPELSAVLGPERFLAEIKTTANLQHPHILPLFDSGSVDGLLYYVMPYVEGETLRARLEREGQLPVADAVRIARETADALDHAHAHGVVHRDVKPENVLLQGGHALVADFGIALAVEQSGEGRLTRSGISLGTPQYMAPEQALAERRLDRRADIYALGAVLYEMLTGEPPFRATSSQAIVAKIVTERPASPRALRNTVPTAVDAAVLRALEKLPADRFATAREFAEALDAPGPVVTHDVPAPAPAAARDGARRAAARALRVVPWLLLAGVGIWALRPRAEPGELQLARQLTFDGTVIGAAISPDGAWLAYVTDDCLGQAEPCGFTLQVREVDGTQSVRLARWRTLEGGLEWSPDGATILFRGAEEAGPSHWHLTSRLGGALRRMPVDAPIAAFAAGGRVALVEGAPGRQVLRHVDATSLAVVDSAHMPRGFTVQALAFRRAAPSLAATLSPTGLALSNMVALLDERGRIVDTLAMPMPPRIRWDPAERAVLLVTYGPGVANELRAIGVSRGRFERGRRPTVLGQVQPPLVGGFDAARVGRVVVVNNQTHMEVRAARLGAPDTAWTTVSQRTGYIDARSISPDGAFVVGEATDNLGDNIYAFPLAGGAPRALSAARGTRAAPQWSPSGRRVAYVRSEESLDARTPTEQRLPSGLVFVGVDGGREALVRRRTMHLRGFAWLDEATLVVRQDLGSLVVVDTAGTVRDSVTLPDSLAAPTGLSVHLPTRRLAFWSGRGNALVVMDLRSRRVLRSLPSEAALAPAGWGSDGSLYVAAIRVGAFLATQTRSRTLYRLPPDGESLVRVRELPPQCSPPSVSPDASRVVCTVLDTRPDVWLADRPGRSGW